MTVLVIGLGDDGPSGLSEPARRAIAAAELLVGGRRHLALFAEHPAEKLTLADDVEAVLARLAAAANERRCVVLASGDPCFYGIGPLVAARLGRERVEILPAPSSVALAFARLGLAWEDARVFSAHGRPLEPLLAEAVAARKAAFLTDDRNTPATIAAALLAAGRPDGPAWVLEHLGGPAERVVAARLAELPGRQFARLNVLVTEAGGGRRKAEEDEGETEGGRPETEGGRRKAEEAEGEALGGRRETEEDEGETGGGRRETAGEGVWFGRPEGELAVVRGQITKAEARAVTLAKLRLPRVGVLWDVGAGSGSLAIEAAGLMPGGTIFAVERAAEQLAVLRENLGRWPAPTVRPVEGAAPGALADLPRPDRVFVGGGGRELGAIVAACLARLGGRGRLVVNAATLESVGEARAAVRAAGWREELVHLAVARGRTIGGRTRLEALNPVFILTAWPEADHR